MMTHLRRLALAAVLALLPLASAAAAPPTPLPSAVFSTAGLSLSVTTSSARVSLPANLNTFPVAIIYNDGTATLFWQLGNASVVATTNSVPLAAGRCTIAYAGGNAAIAAIVATGSGSLHVAFANGSPGAC